MEKVRALSIKIDARSEQDRQVLKNIRDLNLRLAQLEKTPIETRLNYEDERLLENMEKVARLLEGAEKIKVDTVLSNADRQLISEFPQNFKKASSYARHLKTMRWATVFLLLSLFLNYAFWTGSPVDRLVKKILHTVTVTKTMKAGHYYRSAAVSIKR